MKELSYKKQLHYSITEFTLVWDNNFFLINHLKNGGITLKLHTKLNMFGKGIFLKMKTAWKVIWYLENVVYMSLDMSDLQWGHYGMHID
jgi:hypothetical protein